MPRRSSCVLIRAVHRPRTEERVLPSTDPRTGTLSNRGFRAFVSHFYLRFHMALLLGGTAFGGVLANKLLLSLGVLGPAVRFPLGVACAYAVFFGLVRAWLAYFAAQVPTTSGGPVRGRHEVEVERGWKGDAGDAVEVVDGVAKAVDAVDAVDVEGAPSLDVDLEGMAFVVVAGVALAALGVGAYLIWQGPVILVEAAFEMALTTGLVRAARRFDQAGWLGSVFRATAVPFGVTLVVAAAVGVLLEVTCPGASTLSDAARACVG